jgi:predicted nucleic acid-binding protein
MVESVLVDASFVVALLSRADRHHDWATAVAELFPPPWRTCDAALSEMFYLLSAPGSRVLHELLERGAVVPAFDLGANLEPVLRLLVKYEDHAASLADACLVRMSEIASAPMLLTADNDFRIYRRHGRQVVPCTLPS